MSGASNARSVLLTKTLSALAIGFALMMCATRVDAFDVSMTLIAPGMITDRTRAEARVSIRNPLPTAQTYNLELYVDTAAGRQTLATTPINVPAGGQQLHSSWFSTTGIAGANKVSYRVTAPNQAQLAGETPLTVVASPTRAVPLITAAWFDPGAVLPGVYPSARSMNAQDVRNELNSAHAVGVDTIIISYSEYVLNNWGSFYPSPSFPSVASFDVVGTILNQASINGQKVYVGLGRGNDLNLTFNGFNDTARNAAALAHDTLVASELWSRYSNEPSFYGWYLSHEANEIGPASTAYYNNTVDMLRTFEADKPVLISPSGTPVISSSILSNSKVDVFAYQDAVGAGYVPYVYTYDPQQRINQLNSVYASYAAAHNGVNKHLWTNLENWQMNGPTYSGAYPADISRVLQQLNIEKNYVDVISSYEWFGFMEDPASTVGMWGNRARNLYSGYRNHYNQTMATLKTVNFVKNSGFEQGTIAPGVVPTGWAFGGDGATQRIAYSTSTPSLTAASINLQVDQASGLPWLTQDVVVTPGAEYQFSAWAQRLIADPSGGRLAAQVWMLSDSASPTILGSTALLFTSGSWTYQSSLITAPAGARIARIILGLQNSTFGVGTGSYLIDGVSLVGVAIAGDYNSDGLVDGADYDVWAATFGSPTDLRADGNFDGVVNVADYTFWRDRAGAVVGPPSSSGVAVPEPPGLAIVAVFLLLYVPARARP